MKKWPLLMMTLLTLAACTPSVAQIQAAIELTQTSMPTSTNTPTIEPTITNTPEPTAEPPSEPDFLYLPGVTLEEILKKFALISLKCGDKKSNPDGSYKIECDSLDWTMAAKGEITGFSEDTISSFTLVFVPVGNDDISSKIEFNFSIFVNTGDDADEKVGWIRNNLPQALAATEPKSNAKLFTQEYMMLVGHSGGAALTVGAQQPTAVPTDD